MNEYDSYIFWEELIARLARRDLIRMYGEEAVSEMDLKELLLHEDLFFTKYEKEFYSNGLENLYLDEKKLKVTKKKKPN